MAKWRRHSREFKQQVVERMKTCENIEELARELSLQRKLLYTWKYQFEGRPEPRHANLAQTAAERKENQLRSEIGRLKQAVADRVWELDFFKCALRRIKEGRQSSTASGAPASMRKSGRGSKAD